MNSNLAIAEKLVRESLGVEHRERVRRLAEPNLRGRYNPVVAISRETGEGGWRREEVEILINNGFSIFVGDDFLRKMKYVASLGGDLTASGKDADRWDNFIQYAGDIPDSVLDKMDKIKGLECHSHYQAYTGSTVTSYYLNPGNIEFLMASTKPLPTIKVAILRPVDPFLLAIKKQNRVLIEVSNRGKIVEIRRKVAPKELLLVSMWDMDKEIL